MPRTSNSHSFEPRQLRRRVKGSGVNNGIFSSLFFKRRALAANPLRRCSSGICAIEIFNFSHASARLCAVTLTGSEFSCAGGGNPTPTPPATGGAVILKRPTGGGGFCESLPPRYCFSTPAESSTSRAALRHPVIAAQPALPKNRVQGSPPPLLLKLGADRQKRREGQAHSQDASRVNFEGLTAGNDVLLSAATVEGDEGRSKGQSPKSKVEQREMWFRRVACMAMPG